MSNGLDLLFEQFRNEKKFVANVSPHTLRFYNCSYKAFALSLPITKASLNATVVRLRENGMGVRCINSYLTGINSFLSWLYANEHLAENLRLKKLKAPERQMKTFSEAQIRELLNYRPTKKSEARLVAIVSVLADTGLRIDECLSLRRADIDLENCLLDVNKGKGSKVRRIPFSVEARKVVFKQLKTHPHQLVFCNRDGTKIRYPNLRNDFKNLLAKLEIENVDGSFHSLRRFFATHAIRRNVNPLLVQRMLGHSSLQMLNRYCKTEVSDLSASHVSALGDIR